MKVVVAGADSVGLLVLQILLDINFKDKKKFLLLGFIDDNKNLWGKTLHGYPIIRGVDALSDYKKRKKLGAFCAIGDPVKRFKMIERLKNYPQLSFPNLIHPSAQISKLSDIGQGNIFQQNVVIQPEAKIGDFNKFNISSIMGPKSQVGNFCTINALTMIASTAKVEDYSYIGMGATVMNKIVVSSGTMVGANAFVNKQFEEWSTIVGVPARKLKVRPNPFAIHGN